MDKKSEQRKDAKECGDTDIGIQDYGAGGKREQMPGLWNTTSEEVVGLPATRLATNCYHKKEAQEAGRKKQGLFDIILDEHDTRGPPLLDTSKPRRVF